MEIKKNVSPKITESIEKLISVFERFKKEYPKELDLTFKDYDQLFAVHGWYIYDGFSVEDVLILLKLLSENKVFDADERWIQLFEVNFDEIESDLCELHKETFHVFKEAILCHKNGFFYASTILFISLSDGIAQGKLFTDRYFQKIKKKNKNHFLLDIFNEKNPVNKSYIPNKSSNSELMRHGIMHGNSINYGSKINSLKALSLYCFLSSRKHKLMK
jgi:hypothetical protein